MLFDLFNQLLKALHCIHVTAQFQSQRGAAVMLSWAGCSFCLRAKQVCCFHLSPYPSLSMIYLIIFVTRVKMIPDVVTEWHRQHSRVASLQSSEPSIITVRITCWVSGSCCSELRHHSHTWCNVSDVNVLSTAVDSCLCCSVPTDQITFIQDVGQMSLRRFSSRYHTLSFTVKQHRMSLLSLHSCRRAGRTGVIGLRAGWLFSSTSCLVLVAVLSFVSWNMSVGWTWCACFISSVCVAPAGWGHHNCDQTEEQMFLLF